MTDDVESGRPPFLPAAQWLTGGRPNARPSRPTGGKQSWTNDVRRDEARRLLRGLYVFRVAFAAVWVTFILILSSSGANSASRGAIVGIGLGVYPALDGIVTLVDLRVIPGSAPRRLLWSNLVAGLAAAVAIVGLSGNLDAEVRVFGIWAIASGAIQLLLGVLRQRSLKGQWPMIISGGGSIVAGVTFAGLAGTSAGGFPALAQYSIGGAIWYILTAGWLSVSPRICTSILSGG